ncbi:MAG TPA: iron-containing alcohol dehydrogenase, partial [Oligoflexia bacterium]|nr:iron-containing alcohol dehydrogenase [Oligoflexia bacterium]
ALLVENEGSIWEYSYRGPGQEMRHFNFATPVVAIPTVAATSSETDLYAVVTNADLNRKVAVFGESLIPKLAIIDPELTYTVGPEQTVDGAFDVINHVMESYLSTEKSAHFQDRLTEAVVETVVWALPRALEDPKNQEARSNLSWCAALALSGVFSGRDGGWPIHALEHGLSAYTDVAHGRGLSCLLPRIMKFDAETIGPKIEHFNKKIFGTASLKDGLETYMKRVGAWVTLDEIAADHAFNGKKIAVPALIEKTIEHAFEVKPLLKRGEEPYLDNVRKIYKQDARTILEWCRADSLDC